MKIEQEIDENKREEYFNIASQVIRTLEIIDENAKKEERA